MRKASHVLLLFCIIWSMANIFLIRSYAKTVFKKQKPFGIMATAVENNIAVSWEPVAGAFGYVLYEAEGDGEYQKCKDVTNCQTVLKNKNPGMEYRYYVKAWRKTKNGKMEYGKSSKKVLTTVPLSGKSTVKNFLKTAIAPVGSTMYVWGGGWNKEDTGAGTDAKRIGVSPTWRKFSKNKKSSYNYNYYRYQIHNGLDCSGYVGWVVYNVMNTKKNKKGYVYSASKQAKKFSGLGFGTYVTEREVDGYKAGDVMSSTCKCCGHVWIVVGQCRDGSVVLVHSSPSGVQLSGTVTPKGKKNSQAYKLAQKYMKKYYGAWYKKYPATVKGMAYLSHYGQMRWYTKGEKVVLSDPDGYQDMSAEEVLKDLYR